MKKYCKNLSVFVLVALAALGITGCGTDKSDMKKGEEASKPAVAYMIGHTANAKPTDSSAPIVQDEMITMDTFLQCGLMVSRSWFSPKILTLMNSLRGLPKKDLPEMPVIKRQIFWRYLMKCLRFIRKLIISRASVVRRHL